MLFQIKKIVLWPKNKEFKPREVEFNLGEVNVITGASRTGKSAIIPIIDYCLGSDKCSIPVNTIRNACDWFGVIIQTEKGQMLLSRREPGSQKSTGDMFVLQAPQIEIPEKIESNNDNVSSMKRKLDEFVGLTSLDFDPEGKIGFNDRPSFRDMAAFNFQPQNIVANADVFFFKADTYEHREKLKTIFPYILNAVTPEILAKQHELALLQKELQRKQREFDTVKDISEKWIAEIYSRISEAKELGLITESIPNEASKEQLVELIRKVVYDAKPEVKASTSTITEAVNELVELQGEESRVSRDLLALRHRFAEMSKLKESASKYYEAMQIQRDRLKISDWLRKLYDPNSECPICGNTLISDINQLEQLCTALEEIEVSAGQFREVPAAFDRELERVRQEIQKTIEKLEGIKTRRMSLEQTSEDAKHRQFEALKVSRFIGNLEQSLQTYERIGSDSQLSNDIEILKGKIQTLQQEVNDGQIQVKTHRALDRVSFYAHKLIPKLDIERPDDPIEFLIKELTIKVKGTNRDDYLWEIGSGSNWLGYHIALTLGFHQFFIQLAHSPVPSFIVFDQPSQVYFPKRLAVKENEQTDLDPQLERDEDIEAVRKFFNVMSDVIKISKGKLQIIVLDHAPFSIWGNIEKVSMIEEWRGNNKLVPLEWLK